MVEEEESSRTKGNKGGRLILTTASSVALFFKEELLKYTFVYLEGKNAVINWQTEVSSLAGETSYTCK